MATIIDEIRVSQLARDRFARTTEVRIGKKSILTPAFQLRMRTAADTESFIFLKTNFQSPQTNMISTRTFDADETLGTFQKEIEEDDMKLAPTARGISLKSVFGNTVIWVDPCGEYTLYEDEKIWNKLSRSLDYHAHIREYFAKMIVKKKELGKNGDTKLWDAFKLNSCSNFWLDLVKDSKLCQEVINYNTDVQVNYHADQGYPFVPPIFSSEMLEVAKTMNQRSSWYSNDRKQFANAFTPTPHLFSNDNLLDEMIDAIENTNKGSVVIKPRNLVLTDGRKSEARNRVRYFLNRMDTFRQANPKRLLVGSELGDIAYPFACYGFDCVGTYFTGREADHGGGATDETEFVAFASYYSKIQMVHIPYPRLVREVFPNLHRLPHDCAVCRPINSLERMSRDFWNYRVARPDYASIWNEHMIELSSLINTNQIHKAKNYLIFSELCPLKSLVPDY